MWLLHSLRLCCVWWYCCLVYDCRFSTECTTYCATVLNSLTLKKRVTSARQLVLYLIGYKFSTSYVAFDLVYLENPRSFSLISSLPNEFETCPVNTAQHREHAAQRGTANTATQHSDWPPRQGSGVALAPTLVLFCSTTFFTFLSCHYMTF